MIATRRNLKQYIPPRVKSGIVYSVASTLGFGLIFLPKINLLDISVARAGLRIDDVILALILPVVLMAQGEVQMKRLAKVTIPFFAWFFVGLLGVLLGDGSIFYAVRNLEYLIFILLGLRIYDLKKLWYLLEIYIFYNCALASLQYLGYARGFTIEGLSEVERGRSVGICNGPWELGLLSIIIGSYLLFGKYRAKPIASIWLVLAISLLLFLSSARTPLAIWFIILVVDSINSFRRGLQGSRLFMYVICALFGATAFVLFREGDNSMTVNRLKEFFNPATYSELYDFFKSWRMDRSYVEASANNQIYADAGVDVSMVQRLINFTNILSVFISAGAITWFIGLGPGFFGPSTDIGWLRLLCEYGILGFGFFCRFVGSIGVRYKAMWGPIICITLNMFTLDSYQAYKVMAIFYLILGAELNQQDMGLNRNRGYLISRC